MGESEFPWPRLGQKLITTEEAEWWFNAWIPPDLDWFAYRDGYALVVELIEQHVASRQRDQDFLVYPLLFCGRQVIELGLKDALLMAQRANGDAPELMVSHDLVKLWSLLRPLLEQIDGAPGRELLDAVEEQINEWNRLDKGSFTFRYPVDTKGQPSFVTGFDIPQLVSIRSVAQRIDELQSFFDGCHDHLDAIIEFHNDQAREYGPGPQND